MPDKSWTLLSRRFVSDHRIFRLFEDRYRLETVGDEHDYVVLESNDWVNVIPITGEGKVVLIRQYRHGVRRVTWEIPGGIVDPGESAEQAARREVREETGYEVSSLVRLAQVDANPAIQNNRATCFLAESVRWAGEPDLDHGEVIDVITCEREEIPGWVADGRISHALVVLAFSLAGFLGDGPQ